MLRTFTACRLQTKSILRYSTSVKLKETPSEGIASSETTEHLHKIAKMRKRVDQPKKPQRPPFVKNLFMGVFDNELLAYPEALEKDRVESLFKTLEPIKEYFKKSETEALSANGLTGNYTTALYDLQLMGLQTSDQRGGRQLNATETCLFQEALLQLGSNNNLLAHELIGVQTVLKCANKQQQDKYLEGVSTGKIVTALCVSELTKMSDNYIQTKAVFDRDTKSWILNGTKSLVVNGNTAELFIVMAETDFVNQRGENETNNTAFFVDKSVLGVSISKHVSIGLNGLDIADVKFENVVISHDSVIGLPNRADLVLKAILPEFRLSSGPALISLTKSLSSQFLHWIRSQEQNDSDYTTADSIYNITADMTMSIYAMESMTYFTSGLLDMYVEQDCEIEAAILKIFCAEHCHKSTLNCLEIIGSPAYLPTHWCNQIYRDATTYLLLHESVKSLKLSTALLGLQHAGINLQTQVTQFRNPMYYPMLALKRMIKLHRHENDDPKLTLGLKYDLHPSLIMGADALEYCVLRLQYATELFFTRYGQEIVTKHNDLERLANAVVLIYAMIASIARASRSYCIGQQHADHEVLIASAICLMYKERVKTNLNQIWDGPFNNMDENCRKIGKKVIIENEYFPVHPLTRNF